MGDVLADDLLAPGQHGPEAVTERHELVQVGAAEAGLGLVDQQGLLPQEAHERFAAFDDAQFLVHDHHPERQSPQQCVGLLLRQVAQVGNTHAGFRPVAEDGRGQIPAGVVAAGPAVQFVLGAALAQAAQDRGQPGLGNQGLLGNAVAEAPDHADLRFPGVGSRGRHGRVQDPHPPLDR